MNSREIRRSFLDFFAGKQHRIVPGAPVVPHGDPTLLFTNAGMNQFKDVFLGQGKRDYVRCADTQKCIRVSGKHNDLEEVGVDTYHHTLFEMLGNWSFGDYYKAEAIAWAWELLTEVWKLPAERLHATVYRTDDEAFALWKQYLPESQIHRFDEKDNFWEMGDTGPCGPCSEIHFDKTPDLSGAPLVNAGSPDVVEIWNLVFIQYNRKADGSLEELAAKHVDTGMGFERICAVIQDKASNYDTDVFSPIIAAISAKSGKPYTGHLTAAHDIAMRVMADHIRTLAFSIADGAHPGNEGRGYVLRRILRRATRFARNLGFTEPVLYSLVQILVDTMGDVFPEIAEHQAIVEKIIRAEEESFIATLGRGLERIDEICSSLGGASAEISGADAFQLADTFGFPLDLTQLIARERGLSVDVAGFNALLNEQRERSRQARKVHVQEVVVSDSDKKTSFVGFDRLEEESEVLDVRDNAVILHATPFYAEMGGQLSDHGTITLGGNVYTVVDVRKAGDAYVHICDREVEPLVGDMALASVHKSRRRDIVANHSATHILHEALRRILGTHVQQSGSLVAPDHLRFDFSHFQKVSPSELLDIEAMCNEKIREFHAVTTLELPIEEARKVPGVKMFFGDKYGDRVRVVIIDEKFSAEFCGGTHVRNTAEIGAIKLVEESSIAAGVRRITAVTGRGLDLHIKTLNDKIHADEYQIAELTDTIKKLEKELQAAHEQKLLAAVPSLLASSAKVGEIAVVCSMIDTADEEALKSLALALRDTASTRTIALLGALVGDKVQLACSVTDDLAKAYPAGKLVGLAAKELGGGGGGKPHLAMAGGKDKDNAASVVANFPSIVAGYGA